MEEASVTQSIVSVIVPCYNEQEMVPLFYEAVTAVESQLNGARLEFIFVNDGSTDKTLLELQQLNHAHPDQVHYISFSRNFGKESALYAGLEHATGDYVAVMDVDLQDPPEQLPEMLRGIQDEGYDVVGTRRVNRDGEPVIRSFFSNLFYKLINKISSTEMLDGVRDYRLMTRQVVNAILSMPEYNRFSKGLFSWVGFKTKYLAYENRDRVAGSTSWSFWKLFQYSLDGIINFSDVPLSFAAFVGTFSFILSIIGMIFIVVRKLIWNSSVNGWSSLVMLILLIGGLQLLCLGIVGKYIGNLYLEAKHRPVYIVKEKK
ncbi:glycosyltransferase family 2 protein [Furfurilactobacillus entadae]|uniref:glycosyltransferase family 2 protein n=1 Tax=Furfurilactobacillus entadae TaxID=2922307 RepID=UPI0035EB9B0D